MTAITLLDTTLRDGGNQNNWLFSDSQVSTIVSGLDAAKVDVIEVGYRGGSGSGNNPSAGAAADISAAYLDNLAPLSHARLAVMVVPSVCPIDALTELGDSVIDMVRVAAYPWDIALTHEYVVALRGQGLRTSVNLMALSYVDEKQLGEIARSFSNPRVRPDVFYVADSFGSLTPRGIASRVAALVELLDCEIGIHVHNNLGLAAANTLAALESGATWVDSSLCGMARGAGNLATEQAAAILAGLPEFDVRSDVGLVCDVSEFVRDHVMNQRMSVDREQIYAGLNDHHYYFQSHIQRLSLDYGLDALEVGRHIGELRPRSVSPDLVTTVCETLTKEWMKS